MPAWSAECRGCRYGKMWHHYQRAAVEIRFRYKLFSLLWLLKPFGIHWIWFRCFDPPSFNFGQQQNCVFKVSWTDLEPLLWSMQDFQECTCVYWNQSSRGSAEFQEAFIQKEIPEAWMTPSELDFNYAACVELVSGGIGINFFPNRGELLFFEGFWRNDFKSISFDQFIQDHCPFPLCDSYLGH